jgi:NTP pyrophosphatase (non-canonical NTP hydrolase)
MNQKDEVKAIVSDTLSELSSTMVEHWPPFNSAHEAFAVLNEEVDELWQHVKTNQKRRDLAAMRKEAIQVAAMAMRFALDVCNEERGRK